MSIDRINTAAHCFMVKAVLQSKPLLTQRESKILGEANNYIDKFVEDNKNGENKK